MKALTTSEIKDILYVTKGFRSMAELNEKLKAELKARQAK